MAEPVSLLCKERVMIIGQFLLPTNLARTVFDRPRTSRPKRVDLTHSTTHSQIYVQV